MRLHSKVGAWPFWYTVWELRETKMGFKEAKYLSECCDGCHRHGRRLLPSTGGRWTCDDCEEKEQEQRSREDDAEEGFEE